MASCSDWRLDLIERTHVYWENGSALTATETYIQELLPDEMAYAKQCSGLRLFNDCDTLVLLLGFSPDPLLQSICVYQPRRIVLICNHKYVFRDEDDPQNILTGREWAKHFRSYIRQLQQQGLYRVNTLPNFDSSGQTNTTDGDVAISSDEASPDWVFRQLCERIIPQRRQATAEERRKKIVVDITGAKKNMMAGAFLFADYAGAKISYVDFDEYDPVKRRPYGFTCRIGEQPNPYRVLSLRDWTRVRNLYEHFFFRAAAEEVTAIERRMRAGIKLGDEQVKYFDEPACDAVKVLARALRLLELWDNGDHTAAWQCWTQQDQQTKALPLQQELPNAQHFTLPSAIERLGNNDWPSSRPADAKKLHDKHLALKYGENRVSIFTRMDWLIIYAEDEIAKVKRLIKFNEDYRSAFLRAAALDELLLKARVALLWLNDKLRASGNNNSYCIKAIASETNPGKMRNFLQGNSSLKTNRCELEISWYDQNSRQAFNFVLSHKNNPDRSEQLTAYWQPVQKLTPKLMVELRGESIHTYLPIPNEVAYAAYEIANYAVDNFIGWVKRFDSSAYRPLEWQPDWENLCLACGVTFLPPTPEEELP